MGHLSPQEIQIDKLVSILLENLDEAANRGQQNAPVDLPLNLQFFTFDAGGVFAFSNPYGFLEKKSDIDGIIQSVRKGSVHLNRVSRQSFCTKRTTKAAHS